MVHLDTNKNGAHDIDISWKILGYNDPLQAKFALKSFFVIQIISEKNEICIGNKKIKILKT